MAPPFCRAGWGVPRKAAMQHLQELALLQQQQCTATLALWAAPVARTWQMKREQGEQQEQEPPAVWLAATALAAVVALFSLQAAIATAAA